jgi:hypothetical protein
VGQSDNEDAPPAEKSGADSDTEAVNTSKPEDAVEENDSESPEADATVDSVSHVGNDIVDSVSSGPEAIVDSDHVAAVNSSDEPVLEESKGDVDMEASTKQAMPRTQSQGTTEHTDEGRIDLGGDSEEEGSDNTPSPKHHSSDEDAHSEGSEENKSVSAEGMRDADDDADDGDAAEGNKASSESGRDDESEERDEEENFVSLILFLVYCITKGLLFNDENYFRHRHGRRLD